MGEVDYLALGERPAVVNYNHTAAAIAVVFYMHMGAKWKGAVGRGVEMLS